MIVIGRRDVEERRVGVGRESVRGFRKGRGRENFIVEMCVYKFFLLLCWFFCF